MEENKGYYEETVIETKSEIKGQQPNKKRKEILLNGYSNQGACKVIETKDGISNTRYSFMNNNETTRTPVMNSQDIKSKDGIEAERKFNNIKEEVKQGIRGFSDRNFKSTDNNIQTRAVVNNNISNNANQNTISCQQPNNNQRRQVNNEETRQKLTDQNNRNNYNNQELYNIISRFMLFYLFCSYVAYNNQQQKSNTQSWWFGW